MKVPPSDDRPPDEEPTESITPQPKRSRRPRHRRPARHSWICLAGRILGGWAPALRAAMLILVIALCLLAAIAAAWGILAVVLPLLLGLALIKFIPWSVPNDA